MCNPALTVSTKQPTDLPARRTAGPTRRRGVVAVLAMLLLVFISVLAVGLCESSEMQSQLAHSDENRILAYAAAESGTDFMRYQLAEMNLPYGTTNANLMTNTAAALGQLLNGMPCMGGKTVAVTSGTIYIPSATTYVSLSRTGWSKFQATITQPAGTNTLLVTVRGVSSLPPYDLARAIQLKYQPSGGSYALAGLNGVTMSGGAFSDSYNSTGGAYAAASARKKGSIVSNGNVTLSNTAKVNGDARPGAGKTLTIRDTASVTGRATSLPGTVTYPSVTLPATYTNLGDVNMSSGVQTLPGGVYLMRTCILSGTAKIVWTGPVTLYIQNAYSVTGGVTIETYQNNPANRVLKFLPTCTTATWSGTNVSVGELYAPDTDFTIGGSVEMFGRITAKSIANSSTGGMHSDEALPVPGGAGSYSPIPNSYKEVQ